MSNINDYNFSAKDLIFYKEGGKIMSGGFSIESSMLNKGESPIYTDNSDITKNYVGGKKASSVFENMAIPAGLLYHTTNKKNKKSKELDEMRDDTQVLTEDIHDLLIKMVESNNSKSNHERKTRKDRKEKKNISKKYK
jgi:hypothetical protein